MNGWGSSGSNRVSPSSPTPLTIEARFYVRAYKAWQVGYGNIISLRQDWDSKLELVDPMWPFPQGEPPGYPTLLGANDVVVVSSTKWRDSVTLNAWHKFKLTFAADGMTRCYIDDLQIGAVIR